MKAICIRRKQSNFKGRELKEKEPAPLSTFTANRYNQYTHPPHGIPQAFTLLLSPSLTVFAPILCIMSRSVMDIVDAALRNEYVATPEENALIFATLSPDEEKWRDRHVMLKEEGYELRPRLRPDWKPSWFESGANPLECEDSEVLPVGFFVDNINLQY